jgi:hypothetical protein
MRTHLLTFAAATLWLAGSVHGQVTDQFATGNMHFDAKAMDANHDGKITRDEAMNYGQKMWKAMSGGKPTIPVQEAAEDFARGNMRASATSMDTNHDGVISETEFMDYMGRRFDQMKDPDGNMSPVSAAKAFARGNQSVASKSAGPTER